MDSVARQTRRGLRVSVVERDIEMTAIVAHECNDALAEMIGEHPHRFAGLATVPMEHIRAKIAELERSVNDFLPISHQGSDTCVRRGSIATASPTASEKDSILSTNAVALLGL
jgi:hypothetical protein